MAETYFFTEKMNVGYEGKVVTRDVTFTAEKGQTLALIGPNGAGKSTILKSIARQLPLISGGAFLDNTSLSEISGKELARKMAVVLTREADAELETCSEVVSAGRYPYTGRMGFLTDKDKKAVALAMEIVGVSSLADKDFARISDGQRQRVLLARAIAQEPEILLLDEPTTFLDIRHKLEFFHALRRLQAERHMTVIMSIHELEYAQRFSDKVLCIRDNCLDRIGKPSEIFRPEYIRHLFDIPKDLWIEDADREIEELPPADIERRSFEIIGEELEIRGIRLPEKEEAITKRAIHTSADFEYADTLYYSENAVDIARELIRQGADIVTDTNMALSGISKKTLSKFGGSVHCFMADEEVAKEASERGVTRAFVSMEKAAADLGGAPFHGMKKSENAGDKKPLIFAIGNAPTALLSLKKMMDEGIYTPDFVIAVPVGFVNVVRAKELIIESGVPCIVNRGRKGGSNIAAALCNALLYGI